MITQSVPDLQSDDWGTNVINLSKVGTDLLLNGEDSLKCGSDRMSKQQRVIDGAEGAIRFLNLFSSAAETLARIVDSHKKWIEPIGFSYRVEKIDFEDDCINLYFRAVSEAGAADFVLSYNQDNPSKPWGYKKSHGDLVIDSGMSGHYLDGIKDILGLFIKSNKFEDLIKKNRYQFCRDRFDIEKLSGYQNLNKLFNLLDDPDFYKILKENKLVEIIDSHRLFLQAKTTRKAEIRLKHLILEACTIHEMPKPPGSFCKAKETLEMNCRSGIYFGWRESQCFYVGKSKNIASRLKSHHVINLDDDVSWLEFPESDIHLNELFYIWLLAPECNSEQIQKEKTKAKKEQNS